MRSLLFFVVFLLLSAFCHAQELYTDVGDFEEDYSSSRYESLVLKSKQGDCVASYFLGLAYLNGDKGRSENPEKAFHYFEEAYQAGFFEAGYFSGLMYFNGYGVDKDVDAGVSRITDAAQAGYAQAIKKLVDIYMFSDADLGLVDDAKAVRWLKESAALGDVLAMRNLSNRYRLGKGIEEDDNKAFLWLRRASDNDDISAQGTLGDFYAQGIGTDKDLVRAYMMYDLGGTASSGKKAELAEQMTQAQIDEAVSLSRQWQDEHNSYRPSYHGLEAQGSDGHYEYH
ncbi:tetratricopeptide repeat protein [Salinicola aestuarinus]|uniref:tetratricopeptide repeat protein n=1 Tax=Salinicola aestuarinus TaxID=1949082 RepID=UPI00165F962E|nr:tetratricopeptide repeat protein [Salinicola aestuarinus]